jgi:hypothetical protein
MDYSRNYTRNQPLNTPRYSPGSELLLPQLAHIREEESRNHQRRPVHPAQAQAQSRQPPTQTHPVLQNRQPPSQTHPALSHHRQEESQTPAPNHRQDVHPALGYLREEDNHNGLPRRETPARILIPEYGAEAERHPTNDPRQAQHYPRDLGGPNHTNTPHNPKRLPRPPSPQEDRIVPQEVRRHPLAQATTPDDDRALALAHIREAQRLLTPAHLREEDTPRTTKELSFNPATLNNQPSVSAAERYYGRRSGTVEKRSGRHIDSSAFSPDDSDADELEPQPSTSPDDPLNWSWRKKHAVLLALIPGCLLSDWTLTWGTTVFELQAPEW